MVKQRGSIGVDVLIVVAVVAVLGGWKPFDLFKPKPPTKEVLELQAVVNDLQTQVNEKRELKDTTLSAERAKQIEQTQWGQQMVAGAQETLERIPEQSRTLETNLASDFLRRASFSLGQAVGELPADKRAEILFIVDKALSETEAERNMAQAMLLRKEQELKQLAEERDRYKQVLTQTEQELSTLVTEYNQAKTGLDSATVDLTRWADKTNQAIRQSASLSGLIDTIVRGLIIAVVGYLFVAFILPGIVKHLSPGKLKSFLRDVAGYLTNPLLYHDAKKKLSTKTISNE